MMRIYLAARYSRHPEMQGYAHQLQALGHEVTARWIWGGHDLRATEMGFASSDHEALQSYWATEDWEDLMQADVFIAFTEAPGDVPGRSRGGRHVELGAAIASEKAVIVVGHRENVFCWLPHVAFAETWQDALDELSASEAAA